MYYDKIPRVIFQYYPYDTITYSKKKKILTLIHNNRDWGYKLITDSEIESFLKDNRKLLRKFRLSNNKKELVKKYVLYNYGGAFVDIDECNVKLNEYNGFIDTNTFTISMKKNKRLLDKSYKRAVKLLISEICQSR